MNYSQAIGILNIDQTIEIESQLKSKYRQLMKRYHPDNVGDNEELKNKSIEINEAYNFLREYIEKDKLKKELDRISNNRVIGNRIISLSELLDILNYSKDKVMDKSELHKYNVYVVVTLDLFNGREWIEKSSYFKYESNSVGRMMFDVPVDDISEVINLGIKLIDKEYMIRLSLKRTEFTFSYNGIKLELTFNKVVG